MNGGYVMVDCTGVDLTKTGDTTQTKSGIYTALKTAFATGKPLVAYGMIWGTGKPMSPIPFFMQEWSSTLIVCTASILNIAVTNEDVITITDLTV